MILYDSMTSCDDKEGLAKNSNDHDCVLFRVRGFGRTYEGENGAHDFEEPGAFWCWRVVYRSLICRYHRARLGFF